MSRPAKLRILVADDHFIVRSGLVSLIHAEPDMSVVAQAADGAEAVALFTQHQPDVALLDLRMPVRSGTEAIEQIRRDHPHARILVLTAFSGDEDIRKALRAGARGYVLKSSTGEGLIPAIRAVAAGEPWIPNDVATRLAMRSSYEELTSREIQVLQEIAKGKANKEIAAVLAISEYTVKDHLKNIMGKLHVAVRTEAVTAAVQRGIIEL
ncbi:response regulator [Opitutus terrae]|uniref:Two component transcriptional regulator, LuxR family n=1 Tax=Opitutus terrae (strain DSM 11246 / JCM 15787 / PB90-1) TaxID=452637 RepID=B1ZR82_OPITP|nr:response regulator transcription factor [Opitutus terrae]ACB74569.1 two component transcriptional regulator, LuxR family [Opitutus terrae PB90-1]